MSGGKKIARAAAVVMLATLFSRLFGFVRDTVIAGNFGATMQTDAYMMAFTIPSMVAMALAAAFNAAFVPVFNKYLADEQEEEAQVMASIIINILTVAFLVITGLALLYAPALVRLMAPGFNAEATRLTVIMIRIIFPGLIFIGLMGLASGMLNSYRHFLTPALGPMVTSIIIVAAIYFLSPRYGIVSVAIGTLLGYAGQFAVQIPVMARKGFRYRPAFNFSHPGVRRAFKLMGPVILAAALGQAAILVERRLGSGLVSGSISALNFAFRVTQLPQALFVTAVSVPLFPAIAGYAARGELAEVRETLVKGINFFALLLIPVIAGLIVLNKPLIRLLFQRGAFDAQATEMTALLLGIYALALFPLALRDILTKGFYALHDTVTPVAVTAVTVTVNIVLDFILVRSIGAGGLAVGAVAGIFINAGCLYFLLGRKIDGLAMGQVMWLLVKVVTASAVMAGTVYATSLALAAGLDLHTSTGRVLQVGVSALVGSLTYLVMILVLRVGEFYELINLFRDYRKKRRLSG